jgi:hypothetical protein
MKYITCQRVGSLRSVQEGQADAKQKSNDKGGITRVGAPLHTAHTLREERMRLENSQRKGRGNTKYWRKGQKMK